MTDALPERPARRRPAREPARARGGARAAAVQARQRHVGPGGAAAAAARRVRADPARRPDARARRLRDRRVHQAPQAHARRSRSSSSRRSPRSATTSSAATRPARSTTSSSRTTRSCCARRSRSSSSCTRRRAQVHRSEELLRATFDCAPIGMARLDETGAIQQVNRALCAGARHARGRAARAHARLDHAPRRRRARRQAAPRPAARARATATRSRSGSSTRSGDRDRARCCRSRSRATRTARCARCSSRCRTSASASARSSRGRSSCASRPRARRPRRPPSASARSASITDAALAPLGLRELLERAAGAHQRRCSASTAPRSLLEEGDVGHVVVHAAGEAAAFVQEHGPAPEGVLAARIMREQRAGGRSPTREPTRELGNHALGEAVTSMLGVPLLVGDVRDRRARGRHAVRAALHRPRTSTCSSSPPTAPRWRSSACGYFERQQSIAEELQRSLLPQIAAARPRPGDGRALLRRRRGHARGRRLVRHDPAARRARSRWSSATSPGAACRPRR